MTLLTASACPFPLVVSWSWIPILDTQFTTVPSGSLTIKLKSVVQNEGVRNPKPNDNVSPHKPLSIHISDVCQWLSLNSFSEVISANQESPLIPCYLGKGPHNIQSPLSKRSRTRQWIEETPWLMNVWSESLTLVTFLHILLCFLLYIWPPIPLNEGPFAYLATNILEWLPQIHSCNSSKSGSIASGWTHSK